MEPIDPFLGPNFHPDAQEKRKIGKKKAGDIKFSSILETTEGATSSGDHGYQGLANPDQDLESLLDHVHEMGDKVKASTALGVVLEYKQAVRDFLSYVIRHTMTVEWKESGPNVRRRKRFTLIKVIDQKLERLAAGIMQNQHDQLEVLRRIDEISGLLIDLMG